MPSRTTFCLSLLCLAACQDSGDDTAGSSSSATTTTGNADTSSSGAAPTTGSADTTTTASPTTDATTSTSSSTTTTTADDTTQGLDTATTTPGDTTTTTGDDTTTGSTTDDTDTTGEPSPYDGEPLPQADLGEWTWIPVPEAKCRDGSSTGIGVRYGSEPGLVVYFQGGGACFNSATCGQNPDSFGAGSFANLAQNAGTKGLFDKDAPTNPIADWSVVFVPYCTGDVHTGSKPDSAVPGVPEPQQFLGYVNVELYLQRVVPTFLASVDHVLVTGESAGGFGAAFNYDRIEKAFPEQAVTLVDDSGPVMSDTYLAPCLQKQWRDLWAMDISIPADCADCFNGDGGGLSNLVRYLGQAHPDQRLALVSSLQDQTIRYFFGFGANNCAGGVVSGATFTAGLVDLRDKWMNDPSDTWGTFYLTGSQHTWLSQSFYSAKVGDVALIDWFADLLAGTAADVAP